MLTWKDTFIDCVGIGADVYEYNKVKTSYNNDIVHVIIVMPRMVESWLICRLPMQGQGKGKERKGKERKEKEKQTFSRTRTPALDKSSR